MVKLNGGYNMLDLTADDVYVQAKNIVDVQNKKPTFIFDGTNTTAIQTIVLNNDSTITINGELTIATDGTLTPNDWKIHVFSSGHLYTLTLHYSDYCFTVYTPTIGAFALNTEYDFVDSNDDYVLSVELTESLLNILTIIGVGDYRGIPFVYVGDLNTNYLNKSNDTSIYIQDRDDFSDIINVDLTDRIVNSSNGEYWFIKFTQLF